MKYKDFETLKSNEDFKRVYTKESPMQTGSLSCI